MADTAQRRRILAPSAGTAGANRFLSGVLPHAARAHARRCRTLGPPAHALPVQNGASLDAENWTV
jgi:hypothetical protein